jgi:nucleoside-diphosphate-sugar epimerase
VTAFASSARTRQLADGGILAVRDLASITPADVDGAHVIHLAYLTKEKAELLGERAFTDTNLAIDDLLFAALQQSTPASLFVASSGAASLAAKGVDIHPYGMAKMRQEARFLEWSAKAGIPVLAGRIFNIAGPYINKVKAYAVSNFALQARETGEIVIEAAIPVFRSYLHVKDLCELVIKAGSSRIGRFCPIDLCGAEAVEMEDLAAIVARVVGMAGMVRRGPLDLGRSSSYLGEFADTKVLAMQLGYNLLGLEQQVIDTVAWMASNEDRNVRSTVKMVNRM